MKSVKKRTWRNIKEGTLSIRYRKVHTDYSRLDCR